MKQLIIIAFFVLQILSGYSQNVTVTSPNNKISVELINEQNTNVGEWCLKVNYINNDKTSEAIPRIDLGLLRNDQEFSKELKFLKADKPLRINEQYIMLLGKRTECSNSANQIIVNFENLNKSKLNLLNSSG